MDTKTILIVDDDTRNIFALSLVLKTRGYTSISTTHAAEGIKLLRENNNIGIVLMDMMMPDVDGYQALKIIKEDEQLKQIPVIAVTAQAMIGDKEKCLQAGAVAYISKPVDVDLLITMLNNFLK